MTYRNSQGSLKIHPPLSYCAPDRLLSGWRWKLCSTVHFTSWVEFPYERKTYRFNLVTWCQQCIIFYLFCALLTKKQSWVREPPISWILTCFRGQSMFPKEILQWVRCGLMNGLYFQCWLNPAVQNLVNRPSVEWQLQ